MIDHIGFPVSDYARAKAFYLKALAPLDYTLVMEVTQEEHGRRFRRQRKARFLDRRRRRVGQAAACRDFGEGPRHGGRVLQGSLGSRRTRQRRPRNSGALPPELLRRLRARSRRPQHRGCLPRACLERDGLGCRGYIAGPEPRIAKTTPCKVQWARLGAPRWLASGARDGNFAATSPLSPLEFKPSGDVMPIEPPEIPPATPGQPTEPPPESPPGNPNPEIPPPVPEPGEPSQPQELPGKTPDELPTREPNSPTTPNPATDLAGT